MEILPYIAFVVIGIVSGFFGGLLGISGGVITVPLLLGTLLLMDYPQAYAMHTALGTSLASIIFTAAGATWMQSRKQNVFWDPVLKMLPGIIIGTLIGAGVAHFLSGVLLEIFFGFFACILGVHYLRPFIPHHPFKWLQEKNHFLLIGLTVGFAASILGIGGGIFMFPILLAMNYPEKKAIGTSSASGLFITFFGSIGFWLFGLTDVEVNASLGYLYVPALLIIGIASLFTVPLGVQYMDRISNAKLRKIFAVALILVGILMIF
jgi:uncharacterized membrane protein YfcA